MASIAATAAVASGATTPGGAVQPRPNVVLILADDLGYGDLGSYGHPVLRTPNLDRLAREGMRFTSYYAPSPLCSPSRAALMTGRTPFRVGIESWIPEDTDVQLRAGEITLATLLRERGYATMLSGKWHLNGGLDVEAHTQPHHHGFERWLALHAFPIPHNGNPRNFFRDGEPLGEVEGFTADIVIDEAIAWLEGRDATRPFFLYVPMIEPHSTIANPDEFNSLYADFTRGEPEPFENGLPAPPPNLEARGPGEYYANVTYMDHQIGRLLRRLDALGLRESTFVFFASDNGPVTTDWRHWWETNLYGSTAGLRGRKADLYEGGIRVPAIARYPGVIPAGSSSDAALSGYDVLPTLATIAGFDVPSDRPIDGEDFSAVLRGREWIRQRPLYWEFADDQGMHFALRNGGWKLLADRSLDKVRLYDLDADPFELQDLAAVRRDVLAELIDDLAEIRDSVQGDPLRPGGRQAAARH